MKATEARGKSGAAPTPVPETLPVAPGWRASGSARQLLALQRSVGNQTLLRLLSQHARSPSPVVIQPKLAIGAVDDPLEREADRVADQVTRMPQSPPVVTTGPTLVQPKCAVCAEADEETLHRATAQGFDGRVPVGTSAPPAVTDALARPGRGLDAATRAYFEPRFGHSFGDVRVHSEAADARSAEVIGARAYTVGRDIVFARGEFTPHSRAGQALLAHELTHVVQQSRGGRPAAQAGDAALEAEAGRIAGTVAFDNRMEVEGASGIGIARQAADEDAPRHGGAYLAYMRISMPKSDRMTHWASEEDRQTTIREYVRFSATRPDLQALHDEAVAAYPELAAPAAPAAPTPATSHMLPTNLADLKAFALSGSGRQTVGDKPREASAAATGSIPVNLTYTVVGMQGGVPSNAEREAIGSFVQSGALVPAAGGTSQPGTAGGTWDAPGFLAGTGRALERFVDPLPNVVNPAAPNAYTRFFGPTEAADLFSPGRISGRSDLRPRFFQSSSPQTMQRAVELFRQEGVSSAEMGELLRAMRTRGVAGLTSAETDLLARVTRVHAEVAGATPASPLLSLTELTPEAALARFPPTGAGAPGTIAQRAYVVRVQIDPNDVAQVNELLARTGAQRLAPELEVVVALDLAPTALQGATSVRPIPRILSITRNPSPAAPLSGALGTGLKWGGRALAVVGAGLAIHDILTASGPHRREQEGRAFGSFAGGTIIGSLGAGLCIGLGVATAGAGLLLCGLGFGALGAFGGGALGSWTGSKFDE
jgi:hypothetical protein